MRVLQPVLSDRVAAMFQAEYGCAPVVSGGASEPNWIARLKTFLGPSMRPFVKAGGRWDMCV